MQNNRENGSLASYIIVGVLLMVVLVSGLYGVQRYNESQPDGATNQPVEKTEDNAPVDEKDKTPAEEAPVTDDGSGDVPVVNNDTTDEATDDASSEEDLPATGPEDTAITALVLSVVTFALTSYIRSRYWTSRDN